MPSLTGQATDPITPGVLGTALIGDFPNTIGVGVKGDGGIGIGPLPIAPGVTSPPRTTCGVLGTTADANGTGVLGENSLGTGVHGIGGKSSTFTQPAPIGVWGESLFSIGVYGVTGAENGVGVLGQNNFGSAIHGIGGQGGSVPPNDSVRGLGTGVWGESLNGVGVYGASTNGTAGFFQGNVTVTGTLQAVVDVVLGSDCAEDFDIVFADEGEPGTVMVLTDDGALQTSFLEYDKKVAGVLSGAGTFQPGLILGRSESIGCRMPLALVGKVFCKVDANVSPIEIGDLLTTSLTPGHAMKATEMHRAFGSVIGKALAPLKSGLGLVPILVALQ